MNKYLQYAISLLVKPILAEEIRLKGLQALKVYLKTVGAVRIGAMGAVGGIAALALLVCGFVLFVGGLLAVLGVSGEALAWTSLVIGAILTTAAVVGFLWAFKESRWLEYSKSYELMNAVVDPVPNPKAVPQNIVAAVKGEPTVHVPRTEIQPHYDPPYERKHKLSRETTTRLTPTYT
jgi:hypothetical protein